MKGFILLKKREREEPLGEYTQPRAPSQGCAQKTRSQRLLWFRRADGRQIVDKKMRGFLFHTFAY